MERPGQIGSENNNLSLETQIADLGLSDTFPITDTEEFPAERKGFFRRTYDGAGDYITGEKFASYLYKFMIIGNGLTTYALLQQGDREYNPIARNIFEIFGVGGFTLLAIGTVHYGAKGLDSLYKKGKIPNLGRLMNKIEATPKQLLYLAASGVALFPTLHHLAVLSESNNGLVNYLNGLWASL